MRELEEPGITVHRVDEEVGGQLVRGLTGRGGLEARRLAGEHRVERVAQQRGDLCEGAGVGAVSREARHRSFLHGARHAEAGVMAALGVEK